MADGDFWPSNQSEGFADEVYHGVSNIMNKYDISFDQAIKVYELGIRAQQVDMLYVIGHELGGIGCAI